MHQSAVEGYNRPETIDAYQVARPSYHPDGIAELVGRLTGLDTVVEVGAGTGILSRELVAAGIDVTATEPVAAMRAALTAALPATTCLDATAEDLPFDDNSVDAIVAAQSFHWFDYGPALDEFHRVLRPDGRLLLIWNVRDEAVDWMQRFTTIVTDPTGTTPRHRTMKWRDAIEADARFAPLDDWTVDNPWPTTRQGVVDRALSVSFVAAMPPADQTAIADQIAALVATMTEPFDFPYRTEINETRPRPAGQRSNFDA